MAGYNNSSSKKDSSSMIIDYGYGPTPSFDRDDNDDDALLDDTDDEITLSDEASQVVPEIPPRSSTTSHHHKQGSDDDEIVSFTKKKDGDGGRTTSTAARLRRQGLNASALAMKANFAVRSIRRGSDDWARLIKPFVADLAFRSIVRRRYQSEISFRPYTCHAAVLFVDLSSYSKITAAIAHKGAYYLSAVVNEYLAKLLKIVHRYGGDVVKFAGDAVMVVWEGPESELPMNVLCGAMCVLEMQRECPSHPVIGSGLEFRTHCGLTCGLLESEIFEAPTTVHMQRLYHSIGGETLQWIGDLVDTAKAGQVCICAHCVDHLTKMESQQVNPLFQDVKGFRGGKILVDLELEEPLRNVMENHIDKCMSDRLLNRNKKLEEGFIHPSVIGLLSHGGLSPTQIAQMRNLCVLFIAMTSGGSSVNWLMEVQAILDKNRCPIVQIITDDKGVHVIAAVNLYESVPEVAIMGLNVCQDLVDRQVGCAIGMAGGSTFCGVTGSSRVACRWDITGPPAVRAARLMQYAIAHDLEVAIDESITMDPMAAARIVQIRQHVPIKGSDGCSVYGLSAARSSEAFRVMGTVFGACHDETVYQIRDWLTSPRPRSAVVVKGPPLSGKKVVLQRAAGYAGLVPYLHVCDESHGLLQVARTIAAWFSHSDSSSLRHGAHYILKCLAENKISRAHDVCIMLVNLALEAGVTACFVIDRVQFLDAFSISLIRECLKGRNKKLIKECDVTGEQVFEELQLQQEDWSDMESTDSAEMAALRGKICFLCTHVALYNWPTAEQIVQDLTRANKRIHVPVYEVLEAKPEELRQLIRDLGDMEVEDRFLWIYGMMSGHHAGYFMEQVYAMRNMSGQLWRSGKSGYCITSQELKLCIPPGFVLRNRELTVMEISVNVAMRYSQLFDELPPLFQIFVKILKIATRRKLFKLPRQIMWETLNDLIAEGVEDHVMDIVVQELQEMYLITQETAQYGKVVLSFRTPALGDVAMDVCTPVQVECICRALIERLEPISDQCYSISLVLADLHFSLGEDEELPKKYWRKAYAQFLSNQTDEFDNNCMKEYFDDEISNCGYNAKDILGQDFCFPSVACQGVGTELPRAKLYTGPVAFGPMGMTLSTLCRNTFHEYGVFNPQMPQSEITKLLDAQQAAGQRYLREMDVMDGFLAEHGILVSTRQGQLERNFIHYWTTTPAASREAVKEKARRVHDEFIPQFVQPRLSKLYTLVDKLLYEQEEPPAVIKNAPKALRKAFEVIHKETECGCSKKHCNAMQDAIMLLSSLNWKPRPLPQYLPLYYMQSIDIVRDTVLRRPSDAELSIMIHNQGFRDLVSFLVMTPLMYDAQDSERTFEMDGNSSRILI